MGNVLKLIAAFFAFAALSSVHAAPQILTYENLYREIGAICSINLDAKCWKPFADQLTQLSPPATQRERDDQFEGYWMLANIALMVGDLPESKEFFDIALKMASNLKPDPKAGAEQAFAGMMIRIGEADVSLSMRDYAAALKYIEEYSAMAKILSERGLLFDSVALQRCAALIGLKRDTEADAALEDLLKKLDFEGERSWEGVPFGPQPLDPY